MRKIITNYFLIILGDILLAFSLSAFLLPSQIGLGGVTGIALSLNRLFNFKIGLVTILLNIPLFIFGYKLIGIEFLVKTGFSVLLSSMLVDIINSYYTFKPLQDMLLATIFCGTLFGIAYALIFMGGGSTGGLDILAKIIINKFKSVSMANLLLIQDIVIFLFVAYALGINAVMYALVMSFIRTKTLDTFQEGISSSKQCIIICEKPQEIINEIQTQLIRGVTLIDAVGAYSNQKKKLIYVVIQKNQLSILRNIVKEIEPSAFVTVSSVSDIVGNYRQSLHI